MTNSCFSMNNDLSECSREELIDLIGQLRQENARLCSEGGGRVKAFDCCENLDCKQEYLKKVLDSFPDMLAVIADDGCVVEIVSPEKTNHTGISRDNIGGKHVSRFLPQTACEDVLQAIEMMKQTEGMCTIYRPLEVESKNCYIENRMVRVGKDYNLCICRDVTETTFDKRQLENVKFAVDHVNENIFAVNAAGEFVFANQQFIKDHNQKDLITDLVYEVMFALENKEDWEELKVKIRANNGVLEYVSKAEMADGRSLFYENVVDLVSDQDGNEIFWFFVRDVSLKRKQEIQIHELNAIMDAILNNIPVYLFVKDIADDFRYLYWNKAFEKHSGIPASKAVGYTDFDIFPKRKDAQKFRDDDLRILKNRNVEVFVEEYYSAEHGQRMVKTMKLLVPRENKEPLLIGVSWDITDMKKTEQQLIEAKLEAEQSNRLKSAFIANMSHEIRTPLNAIVGFSQLISSVEEDEEKQQFSEIIDSNANLLLQLINDILDLSKIEAGILEFVVSEVKLNGLFDKIYEVQRLRMRDEVALVLDSPIDDVMIKCDSNRLTQVVTNLLTNAIKFTEKGVIRFGYVCREEEVEVYVCDTGIGISKEKLPTIFERFVKLNSFAQGTGLGLSISKMIVERMGGTISVSSVEGEGTEFRLTVPKN